jgi:hypothetical protein
MARHNQILAYVSSARSNRKYEVALEVDDYDRPKVWLSGPGKGQPRVHCQCPSMRNRTGVDDRGQCKHIRAALGYTTGVPKWDRSSKGLVVEDVEMKLVVRAWGT